MTAWQRYALGLTTIWPLIYFGAFAALVIDSAANDHKEFAVPISTLVPIHLATMVILIGLLIVYIRDAYHTPRLDNDRRTFWAVVLFMGSAIALPVYWWLYMRPGGGSANGAAAPVGRDAG